MKMLKTLAVAIMLCFGLSFNLEDVQAQEKSIANVSIIEEHINRGATDYHYTPISYSINRTSAKHYDGKKTFTVAGGIDINFGFFVFHLQLHKAGTFKQYSYTANITLVAKKTDAMGHALGNVTFKNNGVKMYEYIPV